MSFGYSVGDFVTVLQLANNIRKQFVDAPDQFKAISEDVKLLSNVLRDVEDILPQRDLTSLQEKDLEEIAQGCCNVLKKLEETLGRYKELDSSVKGIREKSRRVWKTFHWDQGEIDQYRTRISWNISAFNTFLGRITCNISFATKAGVDLLHERQDNRERRKEHQAVLDWFTPVDYAAQQNDSTSRQQEGTGQWLLDSDEFQGWLSQSGQTLLCRGIPGAGKTIITSIVVKRLWEIAQNGATTGVAYLYCNFRSQHQQKPEDLLASLLKQLVQRQASMPEIVKSIYDRHLDKRTRPSFDEILKALQSVTAYYSRTFVIIDALDECQVSYHRLLPAIFELQAQAQLNLFATSRPIPEITTYFERCILNDIRAQDSDVLSYVNERMSSLRRPRISKYPGLQYAIRREVVKAADGMLLLAKLHMDDLLTKQTPGDIEDVLKHLPRGIEGLDMIYEQAMERINKQTQGSRVLANKVLSWVTHAKRPLTSAELQHALAVRDGAVKLDEKFVPEIEDLVSDCAGLVTVDEESNIIRLVHHTTQEYFERTWISWFPNAQRDIATTCVIYLSFDIFQTGFCGTDEEFEARLQSYPLYDYAARYWGHHARAASEEQLILSFLKNEGKVSASSQAMTASKLYFQGSKYSQSVPRQITGLHMAAYFGLETVMTALLKDGVEPDSKDALGQTPLWWAAGEGYEAVVKLLLADDRVDPDSMDDEGETPLGRAAGGGHEAVVKLLLADDRVEPRYKKNWDRKTPLWRAAAEGHEEVVKLLLADGRVDPGSENTVYNQTALSWAASGGREAVVKLLLADDRVDPDSKDYLGRTVLSWAAGMGHEAVVKLLLADDRVDPDSRDGSGQTVLSWAAEMGHEAVVKLLLADSRVDPDSKDKVGQTPLWQAAGEGHETVVKLLLADDRINPDSKDASGDTPLWWAAENEHEAVVKLLLTDDRVNSDSKDNVHKQMQLWRAAAEGHEAVVKLLLADDQVNPDLMDAYGRTPLWRAAENGHEAVVKLLLADDRVDPNSKAFANEQTPLWGAAGEGHEAVVKLLLADDRVDPDFNDTEDGQTPLWRAAGKGHEAVVKLLVADDRVDPNSKDTECEFTPLSWAVMNGHEAVVKLLSDLTV